MKKGMYMKRLLIGLLVVVTVMFLGCSVDKQAKGVHTDREGKTYYAIQLPAGKTKEDYFEIGGVIQKSAVISTVSGHDPFKTVVVYLYSTSGGETIAVTNEEPRKILCFPEGFSDERLKKLSIELVYNPDGFMTIEEAKKYIPALNN